MQVQVQLHLRTLNTGLIVVGGLLAGRALVLSSGGVTAFRDLAVMQEHKVRTFHETARLL